ncbi:uncharacterized protein LOC126905213 [Daktulosphaira vitifoliae]|uniref:uncharacterized protein LOC126905213 n=1 Tax=Daktulosphaira vitifoliae TaxID=58002 RepID=UPI0021AAEC00|nr:uncharacterized protein LOC126905213 [Daktulosphaira vitifoliae]
MDINRYILDDVNNKSVNMMFSLNIFFAILAVCLINVAVGYYSEDLYIHRHRCSQLRLKNGRVKLRSNGRVARFSCNWPYKLIHGNELATCIRGAWDSPAPICARPGCVILPQISNGRINVVDQGLKLELVCNFGYTLDGPNFVYCTENLSWNEDLKDCRENEQLFHSCDFESTDERFCGWKNDIYNDIDWFADKMGFFIFSSRRHVQPGPSQYFSGNYISLDTGNYGASTSGKLVSPQLPPVKDKQRCLIFSYKIVNTDNYGRSALIVSYGGIPHWSSNKGEGRTIIGLYHLDIAANIIIEGKSCKAAIDNLIIAEGESCSHDDGDEFNSCLDNCGISISGNGCSCDWECHSNDNCCSDLDAHCPYIKSTAEIVKMYLSTTKATISVNSRINGLTTQKPYSIKDKSGNFTLFSTSNVYGIGNVSNSVHTISKSNLSSTTIVQIPTSNNTYPTFPFTIPYTNSTIKPFTVTIPVTNWPKINDNSKLTIESNLNKTIHNDTKIIASVIHTTNFSASREIAQKNITTTIIPITNNSLYSFIITSTSLPDTQFTFLPSNTSISVKNPTFTNPFVNNNTTIYSTPRNLKKFNYSTNKVTQQNQWTHYPLNNSSGIINHQFVMNETLTTVKSIEFINNSFTNQTTKQSINKLNKNRNSNVFEYSDIKTKENKEFIIIQLPESLENVTTSKSNNILNNSSRKSLSRHNDVISQFNNPTITSYRSSKDIDLNLTLDSSGLHNKSKLNYTQINKHMDEAEHWMIQQSKQQTDEKNPNWSVLLILKCIAALFIMIVTLKYIISLGIWYFKKSRQVLDLDFNEPDNDTNSHIELIANEDL